ncbi:hypothetical protein TGME49_299980 [Toxoplasma gondii ME49]|uniref:Uncharacterized protein n=1 Tax=Toxoplasma gondii (strain ATCC 50611 / Me49) TaxID=508771 RepID=S8ET65_TOXGM|nr:hypothetical protein TGME49_299980 [Toxoplasma gondii ME49]EPT25482.1 hypothetical protein TGME49_299980 [Toxoplasma gondii ME49]|eukprot:XP_018635208.1 hypothetical protein TGME49_299980 [Toxoplasma gondii ME49]
MQRAASADSTRVSALAVSGLDAAANVGAFHFVRDFRGPESRLENELEEVVPLLLFSARAPWLHFAPVSPRLRKDFPRSIFLLVSEVMRCLSTSAFSRSKVVAVNLAVPFLPDGTSLSILRSPVFAGRVSVLRELFCSPLTRRALALHAEDAKWRRQAETGCRSAAGLSLKEIFCESLTNSCRSFRSTLTVSTPQAATLLSRLACPRPRARQRRTPEADTGNLTHGDLEEMTAKMKEKMEAKEQSTEKMEAKEQSKETMETKEQSKEKVETKEQSKEKMEAKEQSKEKMETKRGKSHLSLMTTRRRVLFGFDAVDANSLWSSILEADSYSAADAQRSTRFCDAGKTECMQAERFSA